MLIFFKLLHMKPSVNKIPCHFSHYVNEHLLN